MTIKYRLNGREVDREVALANPADPDCQGICRDRRAPSPKTDTSFFTGFGTLAKQFEGDEASLQRIVAESRAKGYEPRADDVYIPSLGNSEGDPVNFVPRESARGHIKRVCESTGRACHGAVEVKGRQDEPAANRKIDGSLVDEYARREITRNPDLAHGNITELKEQVAEKHGNSDA